jgi:hypothetical protein
MSKLCSINVMFDFFSTCHWSNKTLIKHNLDTGLVRLLFSSTSLSLSLSLSLSIISIFFLKNELVYQSNQLTFELSKKVQSNVAPAPFKLTYVNRNYSLPNISLCVSRSTSTDKKKCRAELFN